MKPTHSAILAQALSDVFSAQLHLLVQPSAIPPSGDCLRATMLCSNPKETCQVLLQFSKSFTAIASGALFGKQHPGPTEIEAKDIAGELVNMIAGRIAAALLLQGASLALATPHVVMAAQPEWNSQSLCKGNSTLWECQGTWLTLSLRIEERST